MKKGQRCHFRASILHANQDGIYRCAACGNALFDSNAKFDSNSGWPSFDSALPGAVSLNEDTSHGMIRTEASCAKCGSHLGHLFNDGSTKTGKYYCMNSVCLDLEEKK